MTIKKKLLQCICTFRKKNLQTDKAKYFTDICPWIENSSADVSVALYKGPNFT